MTMAEQQMSDDQHHESMVRRLQICIAAIGAFSRGGKSKNQGVLATLSTIFFEISERMEVEYRCMKLVEGRPDKGSLTHAGAVTAYYPVIRKAYDTLCEFGVIRPRDATEPTIRDAVREYAARPKSSEREPSS